MNNYLLKNAYLYNQNQFQVTDILIEDGCIKTDTSVGGYSNGIH